jgi:hypothetical protein
MALVRPRQGGDDFLGFRIRRFHLRLFTVLPSGQPESAPCWVADVTPFLRHVRSPECRLP